MPPKARFTREEIVAVAVDIIRDSGVEAITAKEIGKRMGTSTRPMFTWFKTLEELRAAAAEEAKRIYDRYAERGLSMTPPFKGFGMEYIRFAAEEPNLFRLLFMRKTEENSTMEFLGVEEGHLPQVRAVVMDIFHLDAPQADWLYEHLWIYAHGIATLCATGAMRFTREDVAQKLGDLCQGLLMSLKAPRDEHNGLIPSVGTVISGSEKDHMQAP